MNKKNKEQIVSKRITQAEEELKQFLKKKEIQNNVLKKIIKKINIETESPNK